MTAQHTYIDSGITAIALYVGFRMPELAIGLPQYIMMGLQAMALTIGIITGILTIMNMVGYIPKWLKRLKKHFNHISK